jgi:hypothetical protein
VTYEELISSILPAPDTIRVEEHLETGDDGEVYAVAQQVTPCYVDTGTAITIMVGGTQVLAAAVITAPPGIDCPPKSRITLPDGRSVVAHTVTSPNTGGLDVPTYTKIVCRQGIRSGASR